MTAHRAPVTGVFASPVGKRPGMNSLQLHAEAFDGVLDDAGISARDVDGLVTLGSFSQPYLMHAVAVAEFLGLRDLAYANTVAVGGASAVAALHRVSLLVAAGVCRTAVVVAADDQLSGMTRELALRAMLGNRHPQFEGPYGPTTAAAYAIAAARYLHDHDLDPIVLGEATRLSRRMAAGRPGAMFTDMPSLDEIAASKEIADPLRMLHCAPIADGGAAFVISNEPGSRPPVRVAGAGERHDNAHLVYNRSLTTSPAAAAATAGYAEAGVTAGDVDVALVYDAFASSLGSTLEDLGLAEPGTAFHAMADGEFDLEGRVPVNPHGGLLSGGHPGYPGGIIHVAEAIHQARGDAVTQVPDARFVLVHGSGGIMTTQAVAILEVSP